MSRVGRFDIAGKSLTSLPKIKGCYLGGKTLSCSGLLEVLKSFDS